MDKYLSFDVFTAYPFDYGAVQLSCRDNSCVSQPAEESRTCGSVFKNPSPDTPAGKLLDEAGAKSLRVGGACVWSEHANVIVAGEGCTSSDILALARLMARAVFFRSGVRLEPEIRGLEVW